MEIFSSYENYKRTKLDWAKEIPEKWEVKKITHGISYYVGFTPESGNPIYYGEGYKWANISDLGAKWIATTNKQITDEAIKRYGKKPVPKGSLLYSFKLSVGTVSFASTAVP